MKTILGRPAAHTDNGNIKQTAATIDEKRTTNVLQRFTSYQSVGISFTARSTPYSLLRRAADLTFPTPFAAADKAAKQETIVPNQDRPPRTFAAIGPKEATWDGSIWRLERGMSDE